MTKNERTITVKLAENSIDDLHAVAKGHWLSDARTLEILAAAGLSTIENLTASSAAELTKLVGVALGIIEDQKLQLLVGYENDAGDSFVTFSGAVSYLRNTE